MKPLKQIFALIDINNCYVSCERLFQPHLNHRPVVVLSNNDGCVVSRSEEAKQLGIKMAVPFYQVQELIQQHDVAVFSSNYALYAEMSRRFNNTIQQFVSAKDIEIYPCYCCRRYLWCNSCLFCQTDRSSILVGGAFRSFRRYWILDLEYNLILKSTRFESILIHLHLHFFFLFHMLKKV